MPHLQIWVKEIFRGKDVYRILLNQECERYVLSETVLDVGSGTKPASYHRFFRKGPRCVFMAVDGAFTGKALESGSFIDLEKNHFVTDNESVDMVLAMNVLEHIYNHHFLLGEINRVLKKDGQFIGAVPFLVGYHADPHDYWRYTSEALRKLLEGHGFSDIKVQIIGYGPFIAAFSQIEFMFPRLIKIIAIPLCAACDRLIFLIKPKLDREHFALGLFFNARKQKK